MKKVVLLIPFAIFICMALSACDAGTSLSPDELQASSRHGSTVTAPDAADNCTDAGTQLDSETSASQRHQSGRNPDCFEYNEVESTPDPDETPSDDGPKPDPRLD